jgi:cold shock CspA family protein
MSKGKQNGTVKNFNSKRGFGFITPDKGGDDVFCHWEAIQTDERWPKLEKDQKVTFSVEYDENGKAKAANVTKAGGGKITAGTDTKTYGDFRYPGTVKWFRGWTGKEGGFGFITLNMEATVGDETLAEGDEIYVSREELLAENPQNPKICGGMEVEFLVAKTDYDKFVASEVTLPGGDPIGDLPEREPKAKGTKGTKGAKGSSKGAKGSSKGAKGSSKGAKGSSKGKGKAAPAQRTVVKTATPTKGKGKGKGKKGK